MTNSKTEIEAASHDDDDDHHHHSLVTMQRDCQPESTTNIQQ